jgi:hypothetical protein
VETEPELHPRLASARAAAHEHQQSARLMYALTSDVPNPRPCAQESATPCGNLPNNGITSSLLQVLKSPLHWQNSQTALCSFSVTPNPIKHTVPPTPDIEFVGSLLAPSNIPPHCTLETPTQCRLRCNIREMRFSQTTTASRNSNDKGSSVPGATASLYAQ